MGIWESQSPSCICDDKNQTCDIHQYKRKIVDCTKLTKIGMRQKPPNETSHSPTSWIGLIFDPLDVLDFLPALDPRRRSFFDFFAFSSATSWRISDPVVTTMSHRLEGEEGDLLSRGVVDGVQSDSASSKTSAKSSSSEMMNDVDFASRPEREERRGQEG